MLLLHIFYDMIPSIDDGVKSVTILLPQHHPLPLLVAAAQEQGAHGGVLHVAVLRAQLRGGSAPALLLLLGGLELHARKHGGGGWGGHDNQEGTRSVRWGGCDGGA